MHHHTKDPETSSNVIIKFTDMDKVIDTDQKQLVINVCGNILKTVTDNIHTMLVLEKIDFKDLASIKGSLDTVLVMIAEITENVPSDREKR